MLLLLGKPEAIRKYIKEMLPDIDEYIFRYGSGYVPSGKATLNKMLCEERLMKRLHELSEEKYDVTRYKILKRTVYTVCTKYEEVC